MSKFCIGIIKADCLKSNECFWFEFQRGVKGYAEELGFEFMTGCKYEEPFIAQIADRMDMIFELSLDGVAEVLLCPDWCQYNGRFPKRKLRDRLDDLRALTQYIIDRVRHVDFFIGESGCEWQDFLHYTTGISDMVGILEKEYPLHSDIPDIHLSIFNRLPQ